MIFKGFIDFQNIFKKQLEVEIIMRNLASTDRGQQIWLVLLDVAEFFKALPMIKIMIMCSIKPYFPVSSKQ